MTRRLPVRVQAVMLAAAVLLIGAGHCLADTWQVVDGDTLRVDGQLVRIVGMDAPETYRPRCEAERTLGRKATLRLRELLAGARNVGYAPSGRDRYGRTLARVYIDNRDVAMIMIDAGLARPYSGGRRRSWCE